MKGLNTTSYLTRSLLNNIFERELSADDIEKLILDGTLIKHFSYYKASEQLLRDLKVIPETVKITMFTYLAKKASFGLNEIQEIFDNCGRDTVRIIARKYFFKKYNYWYKNEILIHLLNEGKENVSI